MINIKDIQVGNYISFTRKTQDYYTFHLFGTEGPIKAEVREIISHTNSNGNFSLSITVLSPGKCKGGWYWIDSDSFEISVLSEAESLLWALTK